MLFSTLLALLDAATPCVWVSVAHTRGSVPREAGAGMLVTMGAAEGTIGGGHLEQTAIELAREGLRLGKTGATQRHYPLGPALGQCCGGAVDLLFRPVTAPERPWVEALAQNEAAGGDVTLTTRPDTSAPHTVLGGAGPSAAIVTHYVFNPWHIWVFGAGHVGKALTQVLATLPCTLTWVDSRDAEFPAAVPGNIIVLHSDFPADEVDGMAPRSDALVLTHSHALDLEIVAQLLRRDDLGFLGMIGSRTKAELFRRRLVERGLDATRVVCPIGASASGKKDKHPGAIAVGVAAELLARRNAHRGIDHQIPCLRTAHV